jgi:hypothetical protein
MRTADSGATWTEQTQVTGLPDRSADGLVLPNGDVLIARTGPDGGMYRLVHGTTAVEPLSGAPQFANTLYLTGGVAVAGPARDERSDADVASVAWVSGNGGTAWHPIPSH